MWFSRYFCMVAIMLGFVACSGSRSIMFSDENWKFSYGSGHIVNADSTLRFSLGDHVLDLDMTLISCQDSLSQYPGADKYMSHILKVCGLNEGKVCFFAPLEHVMWVILPKGYEDVKPVSISYNLMDMSPGTSWMWDDYAHEGNRKPDEIYTNIYVDRKYVALIVVDKLDYDSMAMACVHIYQSDNKKSAKLGFRPWHWTLKGNMLNHTHADALAYWIDGRRENIFENSRLGRGVGYRQYINRVREELKDILVSDQEPRNRIMEAWQEHPQDTTLHQSIGREIWHNDSVNLIRVTDILDNDALDFGEENEVLWAVIQHSSLELQQRYIPKFVKAAKEGKLRGELVAVMQDRIACGLGRPQIYGSQGKWDESGRFVPAEIGEPERVDSRREAMGMEPLDVYVRRMSRR